MKTEVAAFHFHKTCVMNSISYEEGTIDTLTVDTQPLNAILAAIAKSIRHHATVLEKVPEIEDIQCLLRKDLNLIRLNLSSGECYRSVGIEYSEDERGSSRTHFIRDATEGKEVDEDDRVASESRLRAMSIRRLQAVNEAVEKIQVSMKQSTLSDVRKDIVGLKSIVSILQQEHNFEIAHNAELECRVDSLKSAISNLENDHGAGASSSELHRQKQFMLNKFDDLRHTVNEVQLSLKSDVDGKMNEKLMEMKTLFNNLEDLVRSRQSQLNNKMSSFAKSSDLSALEENIENEIYDYKLRMDVLEKCVVSNEDALLQMKQQAAFLSFQKNHQRWKIRTLGAAWTRWQEYNRWVDEKHSSDIKRRKNMRKILIRTWLAKKSNAWRKWQQFIQWQRRVEAKKDLAIKHIWEKMALVVSEPTRLAFNKWRRSAIAMKIHEAKVDSGICAETPIPTSISSDCVPVDSNSSQYTPSRLIGSFNRDKDVSSDCVPADSRSNQYDLSSLLDSFNSDKDGAIQTLAQEINNIRMLDIGKVRRDMETSIEALANRSDGSLSMEISKLETRAMIIENKSREQVEFLSSQLPKMKSEIAEMRNSLHGTINRVKVIEETHRDRLELLFAGKEAIEEEVTSLNSQLTNTQNRIRSLEHNSDRSQSTVNTLLQKMNDFESFHRDRKESMDQEITLLKDALTTVNQDLDASNKVRDKLLDDLIDTRNEVIQAKIASQSAFKEIHGIFVSHGVLQPTWDDIVQHGVLYEQITKEKGYVVPINCVTDGKEDIDVPGNVASFAHDYAAWIAFEADRDALKLVVIGKSSEDSGYVEDNTDTKRKDLVER